MRMYIINHFKVTSYIKLVDDVVFIYILQKRLFVPNRHLFPANILFQILILILFGEKKILIISKARQHFTLSSQ